MTYNDLHALLLSKAEEKYRQFNDKIVPGAKALGIKVPVLREIAKSVSRVGYGADLTQGLWASEIHEEVILIGFLIEYQRTVELDKVMADTRRYVGKIDNWALCDLFAVSLKKAVKKYRQDFYGVAKEMCKSENPWEIRLGLVLLLSYYKKPSYIDEVLAIADSITREDYYVRMANAWLLSVLYVEDKENVVAFLATSNLDSWTINKAIQKMRESLRVSAEDKEMLRGMKR